MQANNRLARRLLCLCVCMCAYIFSSTTFANDGATIGAVISHSDAMAASITVFPDGEGLPAGAGNAKTGKALYQRHCAACHGQAGNNGINDAIAGGIGTLTSNNPVRTVGSFWPYATTLFDYIQRAMPYNNPGSLEFDELYSVTAYVLFLNKIVDEEMLLDSVSLAAVKMPNQDGFDWSGWTPAER